MAKAKKKTTSNDEDGMPYKPTYKTVDGQTYVKVPSGDYFKVEPSSLSAVKGGDIGKGGVSFTERGSGLSYMRELMGGGLRKQGK